MICSTQKLAVIIPKQKSPTAPKFAGGVYYRASFLRVSFFHSSLPCGWVMGNYNLKHEFPLFSCKLCQTLRAYCCVFIMGFHLYLYTPGCRVIYGTDVANSVVTPIIRSTIILKACIQYQIETTLRIAANADIYTYLETHV